MTKEQYDRIKPYTRKLEDLTIIEEYGAPMNEKDLQESLLSLLLQYGKNMTEEEKEDFINLMESTPPSQSFSLGRQLLNRLHQLTHSFFQKWPSRF